MLVPDSSHYHSRGNEIGAFACLILFLAAASLILAAAPARLHAQPKLHGKDGESAARVLGIEGRKLSLFQAVAITIDRNRRMVTADLTLRERESQRRSAYSDFFPQFDLQYVARASKYQDPGAVYNFARSHDARWSFRTGATGDPFSTTQVVLGPDYPYRIDPFRMFTLSGSLTQPIFTAGRVLNQYKYARLGVDYAALQVEVERQDLILEAYEAYYGIMRGQKLLEVNIQSTMALEALRNRAQAFYDAKQLPKLDVLATQGQLSEARKRVTQSQTQIEESRQQLNYLMRLPLNTGIDIIQDYEFRPAPYTVPEIFTLAAANRLELRQASISAAQAVAVAEAAKGALWPSVYLEIRGTRMNDDWNVLDQEGINEWTVTGALQWSFDTYRNRETLQERRAAAARAWTEQEQLVDTVFRDVSRAYLRMKRTESDIKQNRAAVDARREAFRVARERYNALLSTYTEVLDAERQLHQSLGDYYESLIDYRLDVATLERQMGLLRN